MSQPISSFDIVAFHEDRTGTTTLTNVAAVADSVHAVNGDNLTIPATWNQLLAVYATLTNATDLIAECQISAPSLRGKSLYDSKTLAVIAANTAYAPISPTPLDVTADKQIFFTPGEMLNALVQSTAATVNDLISVGIFLANGQINSYPYAGMPIETIKFTSGSAAVANTWTTTVLTPTQTLRSGRYAVVGAKVVAPTGKLARFIFTETAGRPGVVPVLNRSHRGHDIFQPGRLGSWGEFVDNAPPQMEIFAAGTDAAATQIVYLDLVKIA